MDGIIKSLSEYITKLIENPTIRDGLTFINELSPEAKLAIMGVLGLLLIIIIFKPRASDDSIGMQETSTLQRRIDHQDVIINGLQSKLQERMTKIEGDIRFLKTGKETKEQEEEAKQAAVG
jgi:hypothetical protein